jgi:F-box/WD-40 domain protein MET30
MVVELNWRRGKCTTRTLTGHSDGVMCLQFSETLSHPAFPVLISGSYDRTVRVWNMETGEQLHCLRGHTRAVRALQFDEVTLITGSMDHSLKVWDWREGKCIKTLNGHTGGVVCLNYDSNVLASGSVDSMIMIWNLRTGRSFTLWGHSDWVNAVQLWDSNPSAQGAARSPIFVHRSGSTSPISSNSADAAAAANGCHIDPGKMLFSASDDGSIRLWDLNARTCVRQFVGHMGQVQSLKLLFASEHDEEEGPGKDTTTTSNSSQNSLIPKRKKPVLVSGSLDNTIKLWDIETGKTTRTYFGHIEGVWAVASDEMRLVSGSHDRTIKVYFKFSFLL